jgi:hypothetical protein
MNKQDKLELTVKEIEYFIKREQKSIKDLKHVPKGTLRIPTDPLELAKKEGKVVGLKMALVMAKTNAGIIKPMK